MTKASIKETTVTEKIPYLLDASGTNHLQTTKTVKVSEAFTVDLEIHPTDWSILPRALMGATSETYAIGDTAYPISFGERVGSEYQTITGGQISKYECTIEKDKTIVQHSQFHVLRLVDSALHMLVLGHTLPHRREQRLRMATLVQSHMIHPVISRGYYWMNHM